LQRESWQLRRRACLHEIFFAKSLTNFMVPASLLVSSVVLLTLHSRFTASWGLGSSGTVNRLKAVSLP